jgi:YVTN family beta-propeller protein
MTKMVASFLVLLITFTMGINAQTKGTLLVVNKLDNTVSLISLKNNKVVATIHAGEGPHEVAVSLSGKIAAVANYGDQKHAGNSITTIDIQNKLPSKTISLGHYQRPHGIEFISEDEVIVTSEVNSVLLKVNISNDSVMEVAGTCQQGSHMVAYSRLTKKAYVANVYSGTVSVIDVKNNKFIEIINYKLGIEGLDISPDGSELWVANRNDNTVTVTNTYTLETKAILTAHDLAFRVKFLPNGKYVVVSNGLSGNVTLVDAKTKKIVKDIDFTSAQGTQPVPVGIATHTYSKYFYVCNSGYNEVAIISTKDWTIMGRIKVGNEPDGICFSKIGIN